MWPLVREGGDCWIFGDEVERVREMISVGGKGGDGLRWGQGKT